MGVMISDRPPPRELNDVFGSWLTIGRRPFEQDQIPGGHRRSSKAAASHPAKVTTYPCCDRLTWKLADQIGYCRSVSNYCSGPVDKGDCPMTRALIQGCLWRGGGLGARRSGRCGVGHYRPLFLEFGKRGIFYYETIFALYCADGSGITSSQKRVATRKEALVGSPLFV